MKSKKKSLAVAVVAVDFCLVLVCRNGGRFVRMTIMTWNICMRALEPSSNATTIGAVYTRRSFTVHLKNSKRSSDLEMSKQVLQDQRCAFSTVKDAN